MAENLASVSIPVKTTEKKRAGDPVVSTSNFGS